VSGGILTARCWAPPLAAALLAIGVAIALWPAAPEPPSAPLTVAAVATSAGHTNEETGTPRAADGIDGGTEPHPTASPAARSLPPFASEDDYLRELARLNRTDKRQALELVRQGDGWYSASGARAEARQAMGVTLLVDLGEMAEARARARRFLAEHPESSYRPLVQGVTGIHPRPSGPEGLRTTPGGQVGEDQAP